MSHINQKFPQAKICKNKQSNIEFGFLDSTDVPSECDWDSNAPFPKVSIIGSGIAGLTTAYELVRAWKKGPKNSKATLRVAKNITSKLFSKNFIRVLGPAEAPISMIKNKWRFNTLIIANKNNPMEIQEHIKSKIGTDIIQKPYKGIYIKIDIDPINML